ncbi:MAG: hypothetical protein AAGH15_14850 [Myxococcota bacterium]
MSVARAFAAALEAGDDARALGLWHAARGDVALAFDHEPPFTGALRARGTPLAWPAMLARLRSWEMLDRAYAPTDDAAMRARAERALELLGAPHLLREALFVAVDGAGRAVELARFDEAAWEGLRSRRRIHPPPGHEARVRALLSRLEGA